MDEGTVLEWRVDEGGEVAEGEVIAEVESEKSVGEVEAREDGVLREVFVGEGETVEPSVAMAIVAGPDEDIADLREEAGAGGDGTGTGSEAASDAASADADGGAGSSSARSAGSTASGGGSDVRASPRAKQRADELGVDLETVEGSGPGGAITADDVGGADAGAEADADAESAPGERTIREERQFDGMRRTIADRLSESYRNAVHVTEHREVDAEEFLAAADAADRTLDADVSVPDLLVLALSATLDEHPEFNATFEDEIHRLYEDHNVCVAVDVEAGLIAPALRNVESKSLAEIATERRELTERALDGEYTMDDLSGGTFTVTNLGVLGVESFDPIINPPQVAILGVNAIVRRPTPADGGDGVEFRRHLPLDLSFDHRVVDGADAARFLATLAGHVEDPWPLLLD